MDLVQRFASQHILAFLLLAALVVGGLFGLERINAQFFPDFEVNVISVQVPWEGATPEDVERAVTRPLEQELRGVEQLDEMSTTSAEGLARLSLTFEEGADMGRAREDVDAAVDQVPDLPADAETPEVRRTTPTDPVARVLLHADPDAADAQATRVAMRPLARELRDDLLDRGVDKVDLNGLPDEELAVAIPPHGLAEIGMTPTELAERLSRGNVNLPAGAVGHDDLARSVRAPGETADPRLIEELPLIADEARQTLIRVGDVADVKRQPLRDQVELFHQGQPAIEFDVQRTADGDTLESARAVEAWAKEARAELPPGLTLTTYDEIWSLVEERIAVLTTNGILGLALVLAVLLLFLRGPIVVWIAMGIPAALLATVAMLYLLGGSLNLMSLFALIMAVGIIVDDAIVVAEEAVARHERLGETPLQAAVGAAKRMAPPVIAAALTTVAAFLPLMIISGVIGAILFAIPLVMICVILVSLIEVLLILPGHLARGLEGVDRQRAPGALRRRLEHGFAAFRDGPFRRAVTLAVDYRGTTIAAGLALLIAAVGLVTGGRVPFTFFPTPESSIIHANVQFGAGTPRGEVGGFLDDMERALAATDEAFPEQQLVTASVIYHGRTQDRGGDGGRTGDEAGYMTVELVSPEERDVRVAEFISAWEERIDPAPGLTSLTLRERTGGPPGRDLNIRLTDGDPEVLKRASEAVQEALRGFDGVSAVEDDLPWGQPRLIYELTEEARAHGLSERDVGDQLRGALSGALAQRVVSGEDELELRVGLPREVQGSLYALERLPIQTPDDQSLPLASAATFDTEQGFDALRRLDGTRAVQVEADVDTATADTGRIRSALERDVFPELEQRLGVETVFIGQAEDQAETLADMQRGVVLALVLILFILATVLGSLAKPLVVMLAIPFALVGALAGHLVMGIDLTILSLLGFFGLAGIIVNDSIILVVFYQQLREQGMSVREAVIEAACQRLRAVLLTTLTTMAGLTPLLFETSLQAQFLIPMAASIVFGLAFGTALLLLLVPALLSVQAGAAQRLGGHG